MATNDPDFFGEGVLAAPKAPPPRATSPDGLTYLDDGSPTPLYYQRQAMKGGINAPSGTVNGGRAASLAGQVDLQTAQHVSGVAGPNGIPAGHTASGAPIYVTMDPARQDMANNTPIYTASPTSSAAPNYGNMFPGAAIGAAAGAKVGGAPGAIVGAGFGAVTGLPGAKGQGIALSPGNGSVPGAQANQAQADAANANIAATGSSGRADPALGASFGGAGGASPNAAAAAARFNGIATDRGTQAQDMYAQGAAAQGRAAPQTTGVSYGRPQTVQSVAAKDVSYGGPQQIAQTQQAGVGNFGGQQTVSAAQVGPAQQAQAQQASASQAQNQAGFLAGTAQNARGIADLDFTNANQSRGDVQQSLADVRSFLQAGPGPSMAQQQLRMAQESNLGDALSLARSGRGNAAGNMKMALSENAATNAQTNQQAALLRAQEADNWQQRQLSGLGLQSQTATNLMGQDAGMAQAQGQQAISREQIASNVDVNRAGLEQGLAQFNAGAQNQASLTNAQLGTQANLQNAEQSNLGTRLQAQLSTDAATQQAALANARNIAVGQAGTQTSISNAQTAADRVKAQAELANQLAIAQGNSNTSVRTTNANNATQANMTQGELANALAIAQGNSSTNINTANLDASVKQNQTNDALQQALMGYGVDLSGQQLNATNYGAGNTLSYDQLAADIAGRNADRAAQTKTANQNRADKKDAANKAALAALLEGIL